MKPQRVAIAFTVGLLIAGAFAPATADRGTGRGSRGAAKAAAARSEQPSDSHESSSNRESKSKSQQAPQQRNDEADRSNRRNGSDADGARTTSSDNGVANAGTIKIARTTDPHDPSNVPHPGCDFRLEFYGFRAGDYDVTFTAIAPTAGGVLDTDSVTISSDARGNEFQIARTYDLSGALASIEPANQGYHVRVDVKREGTPGEGSKTKVFWLDCAPAEVGASGTENDDSTNSESAEVLGLTVTRGEENAADVRGTGLARTGLSLAMLILAGVLAVGTGTALVMTTRRRGTTA